MRWDEIVGMGGRDGRWEFRSIEPNDSSNHIKREIQTHKNRIHKRFSFRLATNLYGILCWRFYRRPNTLFVIHKFALDSSFVLCFCCACERVFFRTFFAFISLRMALWAREKTTWCGKRTREKGRWVAVCWRKKKEKTSWEMKRKIDIYIYMQHLHLFKYNRVKHGIFIHLNTHKILHRRLFRVFLFSSSSSSAAAAATTICFFFFEFNDYSQWFICVYLLVASDNSRNKSIRIDLACFHVVYVDDAIHTYNVRDVQHSHCLRPLRTQAGKWSKKKRIEHGSCRQKQSECFML